MVAKNEQFLSMKTIKRSSLVRHNETQCTNFLKLITEIDVNVRAIDLDHLNIIKSIEVVTSGLLSFCCCHFHPLPHKF